MVDPHVKHLPELWKQSIRRKDSAQVSIVSLDLAPEDILSSATRLVLVGKQEEWQELAVGTSLFSTSYGGTTYLSPAILPRHEG